MFVCKFPRRWQKGGGMGVFVKFYYGGRLRETPAFFPPAIRRLFKQTKLLFSFLAAVQMVAHRKRRPCFRHHPRHEQALFGMNPPLSLPATLPLVAGGKKIYGTQQPPPTKKQQV